MATDANPVAGSSPAAPPSTEALPDFRSFSSERNARDLGKAPAEAAEETRPHAESAPASDAADDAAENTAPASEAGKKESQEPPKGRGNAEARIKELLAENKRLKAEAEARAKAPEPPKAETKPAESSPAKPQSASKLEPPTKPVRPKEADFKTWDEYQAALSMYEDEREEYVDKLADFKAKKAVEEDRIQRQQQEQLRELQKGMEEAAKVYPDFAEKSGPVVKTLMEDASIPEAFKAAVGNSPVFHHLLYALSGEQSQALLQTARTNAIQAVKQLGVLEHTVMQELEKSKGSGEAKEQPRGDDGKFQKTTAPAKKVSEAPEPATELSGRGTAPADPEQSAVKHDDFTSFKNSRNRRDLESRRGQ